MAGLTDPVQITVHPFSQKITAGSTATVSVTAVGSSLGTIYYQWATNSPRLIGATVIDQAGQGGISSGADSKGGARFDAGAQSSSLYPNIPAFLAQGGYTQPAGLITGATSSSYTTPVLQTSDNGIQLRCYVVQIITNPQSVGNLTTSQTHGVSAPFTTPMQLFSVTISGVATIQVM
jgi:hypothetical protein